jgi:hypothetical protein
MKFMAGFLFFAAIAMALDSRRSHGPRRRERITKEDLCKFPAKRRSLNKNNSQLDQFLLAQLGILRTS